ncbi:MAG: OmpA family protein [Bdellovibrionales bacterium]|nr:OmpA family protein [Bdellovibrionales bacterium]
MLKQFAMALVSVTTLAGCASTMPMEGGMLDDHATTLTKCGVGNYTFYSLKETCGAPTTAPVAATTTETTPAPAAAAQVSKVATFTGNKIEIADQVTFKTGSAKLTPAGTKVLDEVAKVIKANNSSIAKIDIEGHTDATGNPTKNMALSEARANTVKIYLEKKGIDTNKLTARGFGQTKPKFDPTTATKAQLSENRRVEFNVETTRN